MAVPFFPAALHSSIAFMSGATFMKLGRAPAITITFNAFI
jgi:hypothetical protein